MKDKTGNIMDCESIQDILFDYMTHELGQARSDLVRQHLRKCAECRQAASGIQTTLDALRKARGESLPAPERLSDARRDRLVRACLHPVIDWIDRHHILFSLVCAVVIVLGVFLVLKGARIWRESMESPSFEVNIVAPEDEANLSNGKTGE